MSFFSDLNLSGFSILSFFLDLLVYNKIINPVVLGIQPHFYPFPVKTRSLGRPRERSTGQEVLSVTHRCPPTGTPSVCQSWESSGAHGKGWPLSEVSTSSQPPVVGPKASLDRPSGRNLSGDVSFHLRPPWPRRGTPGHVGGRRTSTFPFYDMVRVESSRGTICSLGKGPVSFLVSS